MYRELSYSDLKTNVKTYTMVSSVNVDVNSKTDVVDSHKIYKL